MAIDNKYTILQTTVEELLTDGYLIHVVVSGNSMFPALRKGDFLEIKYVPIENLKTGDIILFRENSKYIVHRLISKHNYQGRLIITTKGDFFFLFYEYLLADDYKGKVIKYKREGMAHYTDINKHFNYIMAILSPVIFPFFVYIARLFVNMYHLKKNRGDSSFHSE
ncbi:MAG: signal peptidase I [Bacteroidia bacterium]|nr:signal peptidase I [Bacteroidia bacterium]